MSQQQNHWTIQAHSCQFMCRYLSRPSIGLLYWLNVTHEPQLVYCSLNEKYCCGESESGCVLPTSICKCTVPRWLERGPVTNLHMSKEIQYRHQFCHLYFLWNSLFQGVEEWLHINLELQKDFLATLIKTNKLNPWWCIMLMAFRLHLGTHEIIFGHLLQHEKDKIIALV